MRMRLQGDGKVRGAAPPFNLGVWGPRLVGFAWVGRPVWYHQDLEIKINNKNKKKVASSECVVILCNVQTNQNIFITCLEESNMDFVSNAC